MGPPRIPEILLTHGGAVPPGGGRPERRSRLSSRVLLPHLRLRELSDETPRLLPLRPVWRGALPRTEARGCVLAWCARHLGSYGCFCGRDPLHLAERFTPVCTWLELPSTT